MSAWHTTTGAMIEGVKHANKRGPRWLCWRVWNTAKLALRLWRPRTARPGTWEQPRLLWAIEVAWTAFKPYR